MPATNIDPDRFYTVEEVSDLFRHDCQTTQRWIKNGRLRAFRPGHRILIPGKDIQRLLAETEVKGGWQ